MKPYYYMFILSACLLLLGCLNPKETIIYEYKEEPKMDTVNVVLEKIFDFCDNYLADEKLTSNEYICSSVFICLPKDNDDFILLQQENKQPKIDRLKEDYYFVVKMSSVSEAKSSFYIFLSRKIEFAEKIYIKEKPLKLPVKTVMDKSPLFEMKKAYQEIQRICIDKDIAIMDILSFIKLEQDTNIIDKYIQTPSIILSEGSFFWIASFAASSSFTNPDNRNILGKTGLMIIEYPSLHLSLLKLWK